VSTENVLIVSSHALMIRRTAIEFALNILTSNKEYGAAYFCKEHGGPLR
jgi:hypothetical protein